MRDTVIAVEAKKPLRTFLLYGKKNRSNSSVILWWNLISDYEQMISPCRHRKGVQTVSACGHYIICCHGLVGGNEGVLKKTKVKKKKIAHDSGARLISVASSCILGILHKVSGFASHKCVSRLFNHLFSDVMPGRWLVVCCHSNTVQG